MRRFKKEFTQLVAKLSPTYKVTDDVVRKKLPDRRRKDICEKYWQDWNYNHRPSLHTLKPFAKRLEAAMREVNAALNGMPSYALYGIRALSDHELDLIDHEAFLEPWIRACSQIAHSSGKPGSRPTDHIDRALNRISALWLDLTGEKFPKNIVTTSAGAQEFISPGPQFALKLIQAMDPQITFADVSTALKKDIWRQPIQN